MRRRLDETETSGTGTGRKRLVERLDALGIASVTVEHEPMFTVEQSRSLKETCPERILKICSSSTSTARPLVVAKDDTRVDLKRVGESLGFGRLSFGKPELLAERLGVTPGSVTPFALINDAAQRVSVVIDAALLDFAEVNFHPLENIATTRIASEDLLRFIRACGHEPLIVCFS
jgi:Ala-tRNA(Pro) deacylase